MVDGDIVHGPTRSVIRKEVRYPVTRAAIGFDSDNRADISWVSRTDSHLVSWVAPPANKPGTPAVALPDSIPDSLAQPWSVTNAISGGPSLVSNGKMDITVDEEVFFGSSIPDVHPRSAVGITEEGDLILLVVDGRQANSLGVDLEDLAQIFLELGAIEAMNLAGGGSSTLVVNGERLNSPTGGDIEREVVSVVAVACSEAANQLP